MKRFFFFLTALLAVSAWAQAPVSPFQRGVNLSGWFQADQAGRIPFSRFGEEDFRNLKALGADAARLPINLEGLTGPAPAYQIDPRVFPFLDQAVGWAQTNGIALILDNHSDPLTPRIRSDLGRFLEAVWTQMAEHYRDKSRAIFYEVQNEPHEISSQDWGNLQQRAIDAIRAVDQIHIIVVGGADWNSVKALKELPTYHDKNLLYTFHFYDPFVFTHQGAGWTDLKDLSDVGFPPQGRKLPVFTPTAKSAWVTKAVQEYYSRDPVPGLARSLDEAATFSRERNVPVWCGEFGVYNAKSDPADRILWYRTVRGLLEQRNIPWTTWDYKDSFGLFQKDSAEVFDQDLNLPLVEALGFNSVAQRAPGPQKETRDFFLYRDGWEGGSHEAGYNHRGSVDYADSDRPHEGLYSLRLSGIERYANVVWTFAPWKDLTALVPRASLVFWVRASSPAVSFDVRFVDGSVPGPSGLPWRMSATVGSLPAGEWHQVVIPLSSMKETGAWDGSWYEARQGAFDWSRTARFEIVAEQADLAGDLWFDEIQVR
jgi:endoglucanase